MLTAGDCLTRLAGALNAATGQVTVVQGTRLGVEPLVRFYEQLCATYPAQRLYLVQDNWPVHFHPERSLTVGVDCVGEIHLHATTS